MIQLAILGGDSSGGLVLQAIEDIAARDAEPVIECVGFLNDVEPVGAQILGRPVLGRFGDWSSLPGQVQFISAVYNATAMRARWQRIDHLDIPDARWSSVVHPGAWIARDAVVGAGCLVFPGATITAKARIGPHTTLRTSVHVGHHTTIGTFCFVGANASINGHCRIGDRVHIGPNSAIRDGITIGDGALIGIGSVIVKDVAPRTVVAGNPARVLRVLA